MTSDQSIQTATVGVTEYGNSAILVTISADRELLDRRKVDLTDDGLPTHPYHHEGSWAVGRYKDSPWARDITLDEAVDLVKQVEKAAACGARKSLDKLVAEVPAKLTRMALRICPVLPATIKARIADNRAQTVADTVMYREALANEAESRGWAIYWYDRDEVFEKAAAVLGCDDVYPELSRMGSEIGPPWQAKHKLAAAAAIAAQK